MSHFVLLLYIVCLNYCNLLLLWQNLLLYSCCLFLYNFGFAFIFLVVKVKNTKLVTWINSPNLSVKKCSIILKRFTVASCGNTYWLAVAEYWYQKSWWFLLCTGFLTVIKLLPLLYFCVSYVVLLNSFFCDAILITSGLFFLPWKHSNCDCWSLIKLPYMNY